MLFEQYAGKLMTICLRYSKDQKEAEDMLQETFIRIFSFLRQFRFEGSFEGWIKRIAINTALKMLQIKKINFYEIDENVQCANSIDAEALPNLNQREILKLISDLPKGYRIIFNLYVLEGFDHNEIAKILNISAGTSRSQLLKAKRILKSKIKELQKLPDGYA
jgi:RNA polymerase sigma factor (sigma-70 family)